MNQYDVLVIGAGPGGYVAAIRAAQLGFKTACVERWLNEEKKPVLGGTCLNVGCIPSKALLDSSHQFHAIKKDAGQHGITVSGVSIDVNKMIKRKQRIVHMLTQGVAGLFKKNGIEWLQGSARFLSQDQIEVTPNAEDGEEAYTVTAKHIIIATGSVPTRIPPAQVDQNKVVDSSGALAFNEAPRRLGVIGAGVIGLELGSVWNRLGSEVVILEALDTFLPAADRDIAEEAHKNLRKQGLKIELAARVTGTATNTQEVIINYEQNGEKQQLSFDKLIVAVGRSPNTKGLGAENVGLELDERGFIQIDSENRTNLPNVYAIGDVVAGPMLAHKASEEGVAVAERIAGQQSRLNHDTIPWIIYTWPEIAWVGKTEQQLQAEGVEYKIGSFPFSANGRARAMGESGGTAKILAEAKNDRILGVHIFAANASELIAEAVLAMEFNGSSEDIARTVHAHPTLSEALHEAALGVDNRRIHL